MHSNNSEMQEISYNDRQQHLFLSFARFTTLKHLRIFLFPTLCNTEKAKKYAMYLGLSFTHFATLKYLRKLKIP